MPQVINSNISALTAQRNLNKSQDSLATSLQRLSSGLRINSAKDDAAGLAISNRFTSQINGLNQASRNANDGISLAQTAEGGLQTLGDALDRIRVLAVQSANGTNTASDRQALQAEVTQLTAEVNRIATTTQFNGANILDGTFANGQFQVGANAGQVINFSISSAKASSLGTQDLILKGGSSSIIAAAATTAATVFTARVNSVAQTLSVNGLATTALSAGTANGDSAAQIAGYFNTDAPTTGVTAKSQTAALFGILTTGVVSFTLAALQTTTVATTFSASISANITSLGDLSDLANAINLSSATTGINAVSNGNTITLTESNGKNIAVGDIQSTGQPLGTGAVATLQGLDAFAITPTLSTIGAATTLSQGTGGGTGDSSIVGGEIKLDSASIFSISSTAGSTGGIVSVVTTASVFATIAAVSSLSITSVQGANNAIDIIDAALTQVNTLRANLGAIQNRFTATISNLSITSENLSASRSRVLDADFASETTNLSRSQILQQAGIAALAQANAQPNNVLALLK